MASGPDERPATRARRGETIALWAGLLVAFSPVLLDLAHHLVESPWARYAALFPLLFARCVLNEPERPRRHRDGILWIGVGLGFLLFGAFSGAMRMGRPGLVLAGVGLCRWFALASGRSLVLLALAVPVPHAVLRWTSPSVESALLSAAGGVLGALGLGFEIHGTQAVYGAQQLLLGRFDGGAPLVALLTGLSWYHSCMVGTPTRTALLRVCAAALLAIAVQLAAIGIALVALPLGAGAAARAGLTHLPWMAAGAAGLVAAERRLQSRRAGG